MAELTISIFSHHFRITRVTPRARPAVLDFARKFIQYSTRRAGNRYVTTGDKTFASGTGSPTYEYSFHINSFKEFEEHLGYYHLRGDLVQILYAPEPRVVKTNYTVFPHWVSTEKQIPFIEYLVNPNSPRAKLGTIQTGKGKTYSSLRAIAEKGNRGVVMVKGGLMDQWVESIHDVLDLQVEDLMVIRGTTQLKALLHLAVQGEYNSKLCLISNKIMQNWIKTYERYGPDTMVEMGYACSPRQFCELLGAGERLIDEVHEFFHLWFKIDLHTHVQSSISLTASYVNDDAFVQRMMDMMLPPDTRYAAGEYHKYVSATAIFYRFKKPGQIRWRDPATGFYSHHVFEQWILKDDELTSNYLEFVDQLFLHMFMQERRENDKCLLYATSVDMCTVMTDYFSKKYPYLDVRRYTEEDPRENVIESDVRVTTHGKTGAAVDIKGLTTVIMTNARRATASNIQGFGRLRELKDGRTPKFGYIVCEDIDKHVEYHESKWTLLRDMALTLNTTTYGTPL